MAESFNLQFSSLPACRQAGIFSKFFSQPRGSQDREAINNLQFHIEGARHGGMPWINLWSKQLNIK